MAIDPKMTVEEYLEKEVAYCAKTAGVNIPTLNFATLQGQEEFAAFPITSRDITLINFDPYAEKVASFAKTGRLMSAQCIIHGLYPHPRLVTSWFYIKEVLAICRFFVVIHLHPSKTVRDEARKIQALYYEMHIGAARLAGFKAGMADSSRSSTLIGYLVDGNKIDKQNRYIAGWSYRLLQVAKSILSEKAPVFTIPDEDASMLNAIAAMHSQNSRLCHDLQRDNHVKKDKGEEFFLRVHRPLIEYVVACQKLFDHVERISSFSALWSGNRLSPLLDDLQTCVDHYDECLSIHNEIAYPSNTQTSEVEG